MTNLAFLAGLAGAVLVLWAGMTFLFHRRLKKEARYLFELGKKRGEILESEPFPPFERAHLDTSGFRAAVYRWLGAVTGVIVLPIAAVLLDFIWVRLYYLGGQPEVFAQGELIHSFYMAVGCMGSLVGVAAFYTRRYHKGRPPHFDTAWENERAAFATSETPT